MDRKLVLILSFFAVFLMVGSTVVAETGSNPDGTNTFVKEKLSINKNTTKKMQVETKALSIKGKAVLIQDLKKEGVSDSDASILVKYRVDADVLARVPVAERAEFLKRLSERKVRSDLELRREENDSRRDAIKARLAEIGDASENPRQRLKLAEDLAVRIKDDALLARVKAIRAKLGTSTSALTSTQLGEVEKSLRDARRTHFEDRGSDLLEHANAIWVKFKSFTGRLKTLVDAREGEGLNVQRFRAALDRLEIVEGKLAADIADATALYNTVSDDTATVDDATLRELHVAFVRVREDAQHAERALRVFARIYNHWNANRDNPDEERLLEYEAELADETDVAGIEADVDEEVSVVVDGESSDDSTSEVEDSGADDASDLDDSDEDVSGGDDSMDDDSSTSDDSSSDDSTDDDSDSGTGSDDE